MATSTTTKKTTTRKTTSSSVATEQAPDKKMMDELKAENDSLKKQMSEAMDLIKQMQEEMKKTPTTVTVTQTTNLEENIPVMSLLPHKLNLVTGKLGEGNVYEFTEMYQIVDIPFGDLQAILRVPNNFKMAQNGKFYIMHEQAVKKLRLETAYNKILNPEQLQKVLNQPNVDLVEVYKLAPQGQQQIILEVLKEKKRNGANLDMNVLHEIGELAHVDLVNLEDPNA